MRGALLLLVCWFGTNLVAALSCPELLISPVTAVLEPGASLTVDIFVGDEPAVSTSLCLGTQLTSSASMVNGSGSLVVTAAGSFGGLSTVEITLNQTRGNLVCSLKRTVNIYVQPNTSTSQVSPSCDQAAPIGISGLARISVVSTPGLHVRTVAVDCAPGFWLYGGSCFAISDYCPSLLPLNGTTGTGACSGGRLGASCQLSPTTCAAGSVATNTTRICSSGGTVAGSGIWTGPELPSCVSPTALPVLLLYNVLSRANTVQTRLAALGFNVTVWQNWAVWPTLTDLAPYQSGAVILYWENPPPDIVAGGNLMTEFYNNGGNVILTPYAACYSQLAGTWGSNGYNMYPANSYTGYAAAPTTVHEPSSPLVAGAGAWTHPGTNMCNGASTGTTVVSYNGGTLPLVLRKPGTRIVSINMFLEVLPAGSEGWKVVGNAIRYNGEGLPLRQHATAY